MSSNRQGRLSHWTGSLASGHEEIRRGRTPGGRARWKYAGWRWTGRWMCQVWCARKVWADGSNLGLIHREPGVDVSGEPWEHHSFWWPWWAHVTVDGKDSCDWETGSGGTTCGLLLRSLSAKGRHNGHCRCRVRRGAVIPKGQSLELGRGQKERPTEMSHEGVTDGAAALRGQEGRGAGHTDRVSSDEEKAALFSERAESWGQVRAPDFVGACWPPLLWL